MNKIIQNLTFFELAEFYENYIKFLIFKLFLYKMNIKFNSKTKIIKK
ncbi:hypothetical protein CHAB381_1012 [Campylobacter hominis ATCC BAA-381]|uniref:Uncharacterized protein n=1 Tax=Campylobacter hominis (strain ATCC BAA-381 / DSM 21671 / CCUG 45161 / LMG 19568 / NCTC 13146 / CH001A) TaxID=360107 RepID=A7I231_CAMHC|nr:hypothetical protein CHAB381_1012 [Campylobacter hominis ATCC BAA-381]